MSQIVAISDNLYARLERIARVRGFQNIEQLLESWQALDEERYQRELIVRRIDQVREHLFATYGQQPDNVSLLREDRDRV